MAAQLSGGPMTAGTFGAVPGKLCRGCGRRGEWSGQPCPTCKFEGGGIHVSIVRAAEPSDLAALARVANEEHEAARGYARKTLDHAVACGEAILEARSMVGEGQWQAWMRANLTMEITTANMYARLANYSAELRAAGVTSIQAARDYVRTHGLRMEMVVWTGLSEVAVAQIRMRSAQGRSQSEIASEIGVHKGTVGKILRGERHAPRKAQESFGRRRRRVPIEDYMIEGLARWLCTRFAARFPNGVNDEVREEALAALAAALGSGAA